MSLNSLVSVLFVCLFITIILQTNKVEVAAQPNYDLNRAKQELQTALKGYPSCVSVVSRNCETRPNKEQCKRNGERLCKESGNTFFHVYNIFLSTFLCSIGRYHQESKNMIILSYMN